MYTFMCLDYFVEHNRSPVKPRAGSCCDYYLNHQQNPPSSTS